VSRLESLIEAALAARLEHEPVLLPPEAVSIDSISVQLPERPSEGQLADAIASATHEVIAGGRGR
jgi:hypothetical protein